MATKVRDYKGQIVRSRRTLFNVGGDRFKMGTTFVVTSTHRGRLALSEVNGKPGRSIRQVSPADVYIIKKRGNQR